MKLLLLVISLLIPAKSVQIIPKEIQEGLSSVQRYNGHYQFPEFREGNVYFKGGQVTKTRLNYSYRSGEVVYLNSRGDTLLITNKERIKQITIGDHVFYARASDGDFLWVAGDNKNLLVQKTQFEIRGDRSSSSVQKYIASASHDVPNSLLLGKQGGEFYWQNNSSGHDYQVKTNYFLIDENNRLHIANTAGFLKIYWRNKKDLEAHIKYANVNFREESSLKNLLKFCENLN